MKCFQGAFGASLSVRCAPTFEQALDVLSTGERRWTVLLDLSMHRGDDVQCLRQLQDIENVDHVVVLSGLDGDTWEPRVREAGASLFISKCSTSEVICAQMQQLLQCELRPSGPPMEAATGVRLTRRQQQVLALMCEGRPNKIIADRLQVTEQTVKLHVMQIFKELRVRNRTQAVLKAQTVHVSG